MKKRIEMGKKGGDKLLLVYLCISVLYFELFFNL